MCTPQNKIFQQYSKADRIDHHSFSKPSEAITTHLLLDLEVDFDQNKLIGSASYDILHDNASQIILDTRQLDIQKVMLNDSISTQFNLSEFKKYLGQALTINISPDTKKITIYYSTRPEADALQWLNPGQTSGKEEPFLFTQGQAILTRTWIPCQDSPGIRITYDANIKVPDNLMAVMSASNPMQKNDSGIYQFEMKQPIPPYLLALSVGDLEFAEIGPRTGVYAEPDMLEASAYEFGDMEKMLIQAESLYGPYLWDRYDVIVLPPSFPFGGMENPRLTFATPTIIAGDRSLTSLIAHELAHSWSGNLVTNGTWNDFWLNEGFTVYFELRIMEALYGTDYANMLSMLGYQDLESEIKDLGADSPDTHLFLQLKDRDPDDGMTSIAYEKGAHFLQMLEKEVGRKTFDEFLTSYFDIHKFQTITTQEFVTYLNENLIAPYGLAVDIDEWIFGPGLPDNCPVAISDRFDNVDQQLNNYVESFDPTQLSVENWSSHEWLHFIRQLPDDMSNASMKSLDNQMGLSTSGNSEILAAWFELSIKNGYYLETIDKIENFLVQVGRRKFLTPLYRAMKTKGDLETARNIYEKAKKNYHSVAVNSLNALLEIDAI